MILQTKLIQIIIPESANNPEFEKFEYFLQWYAPNGGLASWLFEDRIESEKVKGEIVNFESENISKVNDYVERKIKLFAENLKEDQFDMISTIIRAKNIYRVFKDSSSQKVAIISDSFVKRKTDFRFNIEFEIQEQSPYLSS